LPGSLDEAHAHAAAIRRTLPRYSVADFLDAFRFDPHGAELFRKGAERIGMGIATRRLQRSDLAYMIQSFCS